MTTIQTQKRSHSNAKSAISGKCCEFKTVEFTLIMKNFPFVFHRHSNRDVVLAHVKGHYKDANMSVDEQASNAAANAAAAVAAAAAAGLNLTNAGEFNNNVYVNGLLSALSPTASKLLIQQAADQTALPQIRIQALNQLSGNSTHLFLADLKQQQQQQQQPIPSINTQNVNVNANQSSIALQTPANASQSNQSNPSCTTTNENGEMDEASSGLNSVNGWRGAAPYRCGHCHQVSNWKHVIQVLLTRTHFHSSTITDTEKKENARPHTHIRTHIVVSGIFFDCTLLISLNADTLTEFKFSKIIKYICNDQSVICSALTTRSVEPILHSLVFGVFSISNGTFFGNFFLSLFCKRFLFAFKSSSLIIMF